MSGSASVGIYKKDEREKAMKKRTAAAVIASVMAAGIIMGCSSELSNDYVTVKQYKGLEVPQASASEVTDEQVESAIQANLEETAEKQTVTDRAAENGDWVNIDYTGTLDGTAFDGGSAEAQDIQLGSAGFIQANGEYAGFEEQIEGHKTGEEFDITVKFPDDYFSTDMAGKVADFHIVLNEIYEKPVPELTDEWVQANSTTVETADEYRDEIRKQYEDQAQEAAESELKGSVQTALMDQIEIKGYPEDEVEDLTAQMNSYYEQLAGLYGVELSEFIETYMQITEDEFNSQVKESVQQQVAFDQAVSLIAEKENLEPSDEEYEKRVAEYAEQAGMDDVEAYKEQVGEDVLRKDVLRGAVTDYLVEECIQVEEDSE